MKRPTSSDVARLAGVSRATVSYVLNNVTTQTISEETRAAVQLAAQQLDYRPNPAAKALAARASSVVLFVVPDVLFNELTIKVMSRLTRTLASRGLVMAVHFETKGQADLVDVARNLHAQAVVTMLGVDEKIAKELAKLGVTTTSVDTGVSLKQVGDVTGSSQVDHLHQLGHRKLAFADTEDAGLAEISNARYAGVAAACARHGLPVPPRVVFAATGKGSAPQVAEWVESGITAVCAYNDDVAFAVLSGISLAGLKCPDDLAVIGVDNISIGQVAIPALSSVASNLDDVANWYAELLVPPLDPSAVHNEQPLKGAPDLVVARASTIRGAR